MNTTPRYLEFISLAVRKILHARVEPRGFDRALEIFQRRLEDFVVVIVDRYHLARKLGSVRIVKPAYLIMTVAVPTKEIES